MGVDGDEEDAYVTSGPAPTVPASVGPALERLAMQQALASIAEAPASYRSSSSSSSSSSQARSVRPGGAARMAASAPPPDADDGNGGNIFAELQPHAASDHAFADDGDMVVDAAQAAVDAMFRSQSQFAMPAGTGGGGSSVLLDRSIGAADSVALGGMSASIHVPRVGFASGAGGGGGGVSGVNSLDDTDTGSFTSNTVSATDSDVDGSGASSAGAGGAASGDLRRSVRFELPGASLSASPAAPAAKKGGSSRKGSKGKGRR